MAKEKFEEKYINCRFSLHMIYNIRDRNSLTVRKMVYRGRNLTEIDEQ